MIDIKTFAKKYKENYDFLYEHDFVAGQDEAMDYYDTSLTPIQKEVRNRLCEYLNDILISDRECSAFVFTLDDFDIGFEEV